MIGLFYGSLAAWLFSVMFVYVRHREYRSLFSRLPQACRLEQIEARLEKRRLEVDGAEQHLQEVQEEHKQVKEALAQAHYEHDDLIKRKEAAERFLSENGVTIEELDNQIRHKFEHLDAAKQELAKLLEDRAEAIQERQQEAERYTELQQKLNALQLQLGFCEQKHGLLTNEIEEMVATAKQLQASIKDLEAEEAVANVALKETHMRLETASKQLMDAQAKLAELAKEQKELLASLDVLRQQRDRIKQEVLAGQQILQGIERSTESARRSHEAAMTEIAKVQTMLQPPELQERLEDLHRPYLKLGADSKKPALNRREDEVLAEFHAKLTSQGLVFSKRMVRAFHTSLKCADVSPLVVLAGISGTGKSLLPKLYAEYIGIHFLNIAVQPRWDSPQDLFGFYNYMEHRFKATELSRLLWQMDIYNNSPKDKDGKHYQDGLALVLLDEMNLARVEYYFSELLSKLEFRRSIDVEKEGERRGAELEIEVGPIKDDSALTRLFVGNNVLFAGTMNEDETTQVLSDKVVDRANVLRFGKPDMPQQNSDSGKHTQKDVKNVFASDWYLPKRLWLQDWCKSNTPKMSELHDYLEGINDALGGVGRPFGHRVQRAIYRYISVYPNSNRDMEMRHAFADQLEQKVIPKLSGLDKADTGVTELYNNLRKALTYCDDQKLLAAFDASADLDIFQWRGVARTDS